MRWMCQLYGGAMRSFAHTHICLLIECLIFRLWFYYIETDVWKWKEMMICSDWMSRWWNDVNCEEKAVWEWIYSRLCSMNEIIDMDINLFICYLDRVDSNCTFRGDFVRFYSEFLLILMRLCWFVCIDLHVIHVVACQDFCAFIHAYRKSYLHLETPRVDPGRLNRI